MKLIVRENYLKMLMSLIGLPDIKVITGMRRSGKSVIVQQFVERIKSQIESFDFTRRASVVGVGGVVVFMNQEGRFPVVKITGIHSASQDNAENFLAIDYRIH